MLTQSAVEDRYSAIPKHWILFYSQTNISAFNSAHMILDICTSPQAVCAMTNDGQQTSTLIGDFNNLGVVWFNLNYIANILSLSHVHKVCRVTMDTTFKLDGTTRKFKNTLMACTILTHSRSFWTFAQLVCTL
jgi:hypothetical protein